MAEFSSKTQLALSENNEGLLIKTYQSAAAMPRSSTKAFLRESANLAFNGVFADAAPGTYVHCLHEHRVESADIMDLQRWVM